MFTFTIKQSGRFTTSLETIPTLNGTVEAIRTVQEMLADGVEVYSQVYQPYGITESDYLSDRKANARVISFITYGDVHYVIPERLILSIPNNDSVPYNKVSVAISIGELPDTYDLALLTEKLISSVHSVTGVPSDTVQLRYVKIPKTEVVDNIEHEQRIAALQVNRTVDECDHARVLRLEAENVRLRGIISNYESILKNN